MFTLLCRHIDGNEGGREKFVARIADHAREIANPTPDSWPDHTKAWHDAYVEMLAAYDFYNRVNWDNPSGFDWKAYGAKHKHESLEESFARGKDEASEAVEKDDEINREAHRIVESLIKTIGYWWT